MKDTTYRNNRKLVEIEISGFDVEPFKLEKYKQYPVLNRYQFEILTKLVSDFNWVARDEIGDIVLFSGETKPYKRRGDGYWSHDDGSTHYLMLCLDDFGFVRREDSEPWNIKELLDNCEVE